MYYFEKTKVFKANSRRIMINKAWDNINEIIITKKHCNY